MEFVWKSRQRRRKGMKLRHVQLHLFATFDHVDVHFSLLLANNNSVPRGEHRLYIVTIKVTRYLLVSTSPRQPPHPLPHTLVHSVSLWPRSLMLFISSSLLVSVLPLLSYAKSNRSRSHTSIAKRYQTPHKNYVLDVKYQGADFFTYATFLPSL